MKAILLISVICLFLMPVATLIVIAVFKKKNMPLDGVSLWYLCVIDFVDIFIGIMTLVALYTCT